AVGNAEDRDLVLLRDPFLDGPLDHVDQVVMHLARVLFFTCRNERLSETGRAAIIDRKNGIAAVRQPGRRESRRYRAPMGRHGRREPSAAAAAGGPLRYRPAA